MLTTWTMAQIEARYGRPLKEVLVDLYEENKKIEKVAQELGITRQALWYWMKFLGITYLDLRLAVLERERKRATTGPQAENAVGEPN